MQFDIEWERHEALISGYLKTHYRWKKTNDSDLWFDFMQSAYELCRIKFPTYNPEKGTIKSFFFYWSKQAFLRFIYKYNKASFGNRAFTAYLKDFSTLFETVREEGNPRYILLFIYNYYLGISPKEFIAGGFGGQTLESVFLNAKKEFIALFILKSSPYWFEENINVIFECLWEKISDIKTQPFLKEPRKNLKEIEKWSKSVKSDFLSIKDQLNNSNKHKKRNYPNYDAEESKNFVAIPGVWRTNDNPLNTLLLDEKHKILYLILGYIIRNIKNKKHLFAFLLSICRISTKEFENSRLYLLNARELFDYILNSFVGQTRSAEVIFIPLFNELEERIKPIAGQLLFSKVDGYSLPDWTYKAKTRFVEMILKRNDQESLMLRDYYKASVKTKSTNK
ncbi:MAG: hypothetical protein HUU54_05535 [Ignavibacteriaceae bacterium]|nr:hypothetical protein [Ignavibacteriaceae bacterium]